MNARDLLTALNDIDPKLLEDTLPWGVSFEIRTPEKPCGSSAKGGSSVLSSISI